MNSAKEFHRVFYFRLDTSEMFTVRCFLRIHRDQQEKRDLSLFSTNFEIK